MMTFDEVESERRAAQMALLRAIRDCAAETAVVQATEGALASARAAQALASAFAAITPDEHTAAGLEAELAA